ncbi:MAG: hypothetical protein KF873_02035 [Gemmataceae bacterium]|nr:hypothetical protein [Gemmataceae bacterium]
MADPISTDELAERALAPQSTTTGPITVVERPLDQVIDAAERLKRIAALSGTNANGGRRGGWGAAIKERFQGGD